MTKYFDDRSHQSYQTELCSRNINVARMEPGVDACLEMETELPLSVITRNFTLLEKLTSRLDKEEPGIKSWRHLADALHVPPEVCAHSQLSFSPTVQLFEWLNASLPETTVGNLKKALQTIARNDVILMLDRKCFKDTEIVAKAITTAPSDVLRNIATMLDSELETDDNWKSLALEFGVSRSVCNQLANPPMFDPFRRLIRNLAASKPQLMMKELTQRLKEMNRMDVIQELQQVNVKDEDIVAEVLKQESDILRKIAEKLNLSTPGVENWRGLAVRLGLKEEVYNQFDPTTTYRQSPTKVILEWLDKSRPSSTVKHLKDALRQIRRCDVISKIEEHFANHADTNDKRPHECQGLTDDSTTSLRKDFRKEESLHGRKYGLPDKRMDFTGRRDDCEKIISFFTTFPERLLLLCATTGYGRTSIVLEAAHKLVSEGHTVIYINCRFVHSVEGMACKIIEAVDPDRIAGDKPLEEALRVIKRKPDGTILVIENLDDVLHIQEDQRLPANFLQQDMASPKSASCTSPTNSLSPSSPVFQFGSVMQSGPSRREQLDDFIADIAKLPNIKMLVTSTEQHHFTEFGFKIQHVEALPTEDCVTLFKRRKSSLTDGEARQLAELCKGVPLILSVIVGLLQTESAKELIKRLSSLSERPVNLLEELSHDSLPETKRIINIFDISFNRLTEKQKALLITLAVFPSTFSLGEVQEVAKSMDNNQIEGLLLSLQRRCLVRMDCSSQLYSLRSFIKAFCLKKAVSAAEDKELVEIFTGAKIAFTSHYLDKLSKLDRDFFSKEVHSAIFSYTREKYNIKQALIWCAEEPYIDQDTRAIFIDKANAAVVFLSKVMRKQEIEELFTKMASQCSQDEVRQSECLTSVGAKIVLSCMCPSMCDTARERAFFYLDQANEIQIRRGINSSSSRAQCLSKLARCYSKSGEVEESYELINDALAIRGERWRANETPKAQVMLGTCFNDLAVVTSYREQQDMIHIAVTTRRHNSLPIFESVLGDHPFTATTLHSIGTDYYKLGFHDKAITFIQRALQIRQALLGNHQETAQSHLQLGVAFSSKEDYNEALKHLTAAQEIDANEDRARVDKELANVQRALGNLKEAEKEEAV